MGGWVDGGLASVVHPQKNLLVLSKISLKLKKVLDKYFKVIKSVRQIMTDITKIIGHGVELKDYVFKKHINKFSKKHFFISLYII